MLLQAISNYLSLRKLLESDGFSQPPQAMPTTVRIDCPKCDVLVSAVIPRFSRPLYAHWDKLG
jgi:hypothetical protein